MLQYVILQLSTKVVNRPIKMQQGLLFWNDTKSHNYIHKSISQQMQKMLGTIQVKTVCLPVSHLKN
jgi:hypothetical protein